MSLNNHSCFSFRYGIIRPEELLTLAIDKGYQYLALTDINNTSGCLNFLRLSKESEITPVIGVDFRNGINQLYIALAQNNKGFHEINSFLSQYLNQEKPSFPHQAPFFKNVFVIYPFDKRPTRALHSYEYIGVRSHELNKIKIDRGLEQEKLVALQHGSFRDKTDYHTHKLLRAIDLNTIYTKITKDDYADERGLLLSYEEYEKAFIERPKLLLRSEWLLSQCKVKFDFNSAVPKNQNTYTGSKTEDENLIRKLCRKNLLYRYPNPTKEISDRIKKELVHGERSNGTLKGSYF